MSADVTSARSSPGPDACPDCDTSASVTSDLHKYQVACTCKPGAQYARAADAGPAPAKDEPPALPPRPAAALAPANRRNNAAVGCPAPDLTTKRRKYAWWCVGCGALAAALGGLLAAQHILLRAYTASPHHLETVPAAVPAAMLVLTGVCIMSLARRRNRYSYMIKVVGACCLVCALTCVLVTITTTVIHMNKLQTLKFCSYTSLARTCTCFSVSPDAPRAADEDVRCVFEGVSDCGVVHGALYWCLRGVFALSVTAVLVCIFSSMLAYQLLSHERKKMYWEQLELRCRSLYRAPAQQQPPRQAQAACACCAQCHPAQPQWDVSMQHRFWAPGRIGNLYSPNPGAGRKASAWSWFPWPRSNSQNSRSCRTGAPPSGDSAYGFCEDGPAADPAPYETPYPARYPQAYPQAFQGQPTFAPTQPAFQDGGFGESSGSFDAQTGVWGPPPPYSPQGRSGSRPHLHQDPASAALLHHHMDARGPEHPPQPAPPHSCRNSAYVAHVAPQNPEFARLNPEFVRQNPEFVRLNPEFVRQNPEFVRLNPEFVRQNPEFVRQNPEFVSLNPEFVRHNPEFVRQNPDFVRQNPSLYPGVPVRLEDARFSTLRGHLVQYPSCQRSLGMSLGNLHRDCRLQEDAVVECLHQKSASKVSDQSSDSCPKQGKENLAFQNDKHSAIRASAQDCHRGGVHAESEVYFADVSSCCNISLKADCCMNPNVSALVGTIENHPESTSESEAGSFTLTRQQRPHPQAVGSKRRPRMALTNDKLKCQEIMRQELNNSVRLTEQQIEQLNNSIRMNDSRLSDRMNDSRLSDRMNECRMSERMNDSRISDRMSESRISERHGDARGAGDCRVNDCRLSDRANDSRISERMSDCRMSERMNDSRTSDCRMSDRMTETRFVDRTHDTRMSDRYNERVSDFARPSDGERRHSDHKVDSMRSSPKRAHISPLRLKPSPRASPLHPRQSSSDSGKSLKPEFFVPPPPANPPLPNTGEPVLMEERSKSPGDQPPEHRRCCSDSNTMDSGWQSGSEKQVVD